MKRLLWTIYRFLNPYQEICYYDLKAHKFFTVKFSQDNGLVCGGLCNFYGDAHTTIQRHLLSYDFVWNCKRVGAIDKFPYAKFNAGVGSYEVK